MTAGGRPLKLLYGTQTGNSRAVAKEVADKVKTFGWEPQVHGMEEFKSLEFTSGTPVVRDPVWRRHIHTSARMHIVVTSSTGNGDAPDNAEKFLRYIKRRTTPNIFEGVPFAVCALGDSNYELFCEVCQDATRQSDIVQPTVTAANSYCQLCTLRHCAQTIESRRLNLLGFPNVASHVYALGQGGEATVGRAFVRICRWASSSIST
eukprot:5098968-Pleurochrysis_carterae.AAC.1